MYLGAQSQGNDLWNKYLNTYAKIMFTHSIVGARWSVVTLNNKLLTNGNIKFETNTKLHYYTFRMLSILLNIFLLYLVKQDSKRHTNYLII